MKESRVVSWDSVEEQFGEPVAMIDEADSFETDQTAIFYDEETDKYVLLSATGCS